MIYERLYADMVKDATVTDEEVRAAFDAQVEADKQTYADPSMYEQALYYFGMTPYYVPEGTGRDPDPAAGGFRADEQLPGPAGFPGRGAG